MTGPDPRTLGILSAMSVCRHEGRIYAHLSFGRVVDRLAGNFRKVILCVPVQEGPPESSRDYRLEADNLELLPQPNYTSSIGALKHGLSIIGEFHRLFSAADCIFIRGMQPFVGFAYGLAWSRRRKVCHWIVGNPVALLRSHRRAGRLIDGAGLAYAIVDRWATRLGRWLTGGWLICNGEELAHIYRSPKTLTTVSSTITEDEFFERPDTCTGPEITILFLGFVRPEKGIEYLIEAVGRMKLPRSWRLVIAGPTEQFPDYKRKLDDSIARLNIADRIRWKGYVSYGPEMFACFRQADLFVLPTLSEGTPRVLIEARANSLPVIATRVGGIPSSVTDGRDGLLVPPKDPAALAGAIESLVNNGDLRRRLIAEGRQTARRNTVDHFVRTVVEIMQKDSAG